MSPDDFVTLVTAVGPTGAIALWIGYTIIKSDQRRDPVEEKLDRVISELSAIKATSADMDKRISVVEAVMTRLENDR